MSQWKYHYENSKAQKLKNILEISKETKCHNHPGQIVYISHMYL